MHLTRRDFLGIAGAAIVAGPVFARDSRRVIVAGAGLAGLSTAYELALKGFEVTVLEARDRVGGRVKTLREPFAGGQFVETGGELVGDGYKRFLKYAEVLGVPYSEEARGETQTGGGVANLQRGIGTSVFMKGRLYPQGSDLPNPYNLTGDEAKDLPPNFYVKKILEMTAEVRKEPVKLTDYDKLSLADVLRRRGVSEQMIKLLDVSLNYNSIETVSAGGILWEGRRRANVGTKALKISGGNDRIPGALFDAARGKGVRFILRSKVVGISHRTGSVRVSFIDGTGRRQVVEADRLVCTIPFSVLRYIVFEPGLPEPKKKAIDNLAYTRITKVFLQARRGPWDRLNLGSMVWTDTRCERIFNAAGKRGDSDGIFTVWTEGEGAKFPDSLNDVKLIAAMKREFARVLPEIKPERAATKSWGNDEFARGSYSHFTVGQLSELQPVIKSPVGPIHFAGEHTSENAPGMEGALESAERAVAEILS